MPHEETHEQSPPPTEPTAAAREAFLATEGLPPRDRARAARALLHDAPFVGPETEHTGVLSDRGWSLVHEPFERYRGGHRELVFFAEVSGAIVQVHVNAQTADVETVPLEAIAREASEPTCEAPTSCGCFGDCVEVVRLGPDGPAARWRALGTHGGYEMHRTHWCYEGRCTEVCDAPGHCVDALSMADETCTGSCAPVPATFHCVRGPSGCERVEN